MDRRTVLKSTAGAAASAVALGAGATTAAAQQQEWFSDVSNFDGVVDQTENSSVTVQVGVNANGGPFGFGPAAIRVDPGTQINFEWVSDNHNVLIESKPEGAPFNEQETTENTGYSYSATVETEGVYLYYCEPHLPLGMKGAIVVGDVETQFGGGAGGGGGTPITLPGDEVGAAIFGAAVGLTGLGALAVLGSDVVGGIQQRYAETRAIAEREIEEGTIEPGETIETPAEEPQEEIGHDEYDPIGTAGLIIIYLLILVGMWIFTYFVEFLGRGPTVIG